ncbi:hypothetical protein SERLADRAFT_369203 [Serpula lacrymans var. lacrymans S7.9]|uniref:rRNA adenine N(6)-methyltransferase n=1 Tax=Serpula lacrymans var. lacrymans (strain S7.9) TaxID=578457 RepID=F8NUC9_SERL9|nr:uncharacterized protein SERLADRAFT_369203 [Serpula lacrymans var. lacrymans S7.9]EGO25841.1 hypothetical protein SERLADRAFT_369203 [Serpula lacrymans var. lacrymans S7.9]
MLAPFLTRRICSISLRRSYGTKVIPEELILGEIEKAADWRRAFSISGVNARSRISIRNPETASLLANAFVPASAKDKVVIEAFPGPGALTRALMQLPKGRIRKIIVLEDHEPYLEYLKPLQEADSRVHVLPMNGHAWDSYHDLECMGLLDSVEKTPWSGKVHPHLHFISHLPMTTMGEQLIAQLFRTMPEQQWLFKWGRVPMSYVMHQWVWERISAGISDTARCKLSVIAQAVAECEEAISGDALLPYDEHWHPVSPKIAYTTRPENRRTGTPMVAINIYPHKHQFIKKDMLDKWDYCLRRLFVLKSTALSSALSHLAPGAEVLGKQIGDRSLPADQRMDIKKSIRSMSVRDWAVLVDAFDQWPFAPEDLLITDSFTREDRI